MAAQLNSSLMTVSVIALVIPAAFVSVLCSFYVTAPDVSLSTNGWTVESIAVLKHLISSSSAAVLRLSSSSFTLPTSSSNFTPTTTSSSILSPTLLLPRLPGLLGPPDLGPVLGQVLRPSVNRLRLVCPRPTSCLLPCKTSSVFHPSRPTQADLPWNTLSIPA